MTMALCSKEHILAVIAAQALPLSLAVWTSLNFLFKLLQIDKNNLEYTRHHFKDRLYESSRSVNRYFLTGSTYTSWTSKSETGINVPHQKSLRSTTYRRYFVNELECWASHKCWVPTWGAVLKMTSPNYTLSMWIDQTVQLLFTERSALVLKSPSNFPLRPVHPWTPPLDLGVEIVGLSV